jgi:hypothetical protein
MPVSSTSPTKILLDLGINLDNLSDDEDYLSALMEATNGLSITNSGDGRIKILQDEIRRVRADRKKASPSAGMKATKKRIGVASILGKGGIKATTKTVNISKLLAAAPETKKGGETGGFGLSESLSKISESVTSIAKTLKEQQKQEKKESAFDRKAEENRKRGLAETNLEKGFKKVGAIAQKILKPVKSILDRIIQFFMAIVVGKILIKFLDWIADPANQEKIRSFTRFLVDHGPKLLVAFLLFGTTLGRMATRLVGIVIAGAIKLGAAIGKLALAHPVAAAAVGLFTAGAWLPKLIPGLVDEDVKPGGPGDYSWGGHEDQQRQGMSGGGFSDNFFGAGTVPGSGNTDTIPSMLTPGEFVMSKGAVQKYGVDTLEGMNAAGGGTNQPTLMASNRLGFKGGGYTLSWPEARDKVMNVTNTMALEGRQHMPWFDWAMDKAGMIGSPRSSSPSGGGPNLLQQGLNLANNLAWTLQGRDDQIKSGSQGSGSNPLQGLLKWGQGAQQNIEKQLPNLEKGHRRWVEAHKEAGGRLADMVYTPLQAMAAGVDRHVPAGQALSDKVKDKDKKRQELIKKLPGPLQDIANKGLIPDMANLFKSEESDALIAKLSGGRLKHASAALTGFQYVIKSLSGPLGEGMRINSDPLFRYNKPLMDFAIEHGIKSESGSYLVGKKAWTDQLGDKAYDMVVDPKSGQLVRGEHLYDKLQKESMGSGFGKGFANFALGQFAFNINEMGKGVLDAGETFDSNNPASQYFRESKAALKSGDLYNTAFKGFSGLLKVQTNSLFGLPGTGELGITGANIRPGGSLMNAGDFSGNPIIAAQLLAKKQTEESESKKAQISKTQKPPTPAPPPPSVGLDDPELLANTGDGRDGTFGLGTHGQGRPGDSNVNNGAPNISLGGAANWIKGVIGLDG